MRKLGLGLGLMNRGGSGFNPASLFANGEQGFWFDPSDLSTMFTDTAGTTQATVGQAVARINDKSGRGNHATQSNASKCPIRRSAGGLYYLEFDGVDDALATSTITPGVDKVQVFAGVRKLSDAAAGIVVESSTAIASNNGAFNLRVPDSTTGEVAFNVKGTLQGAVVSSGGLHPAPSTFVTTGLGDISGDSVLLRINATPAASGSADLGTGNFLAYPIYIGGRGGTSLYFNGYLYSLIVRFGA